MSELGAMVQNGWEVVRSAWGDLEAFVHAHAWIGWSLLLMSVLTLVLSAIFIPRLIARLPEDHYLENREDAIGVASSGGNLVAVITKNILGGVLVVAGVLMLVLPGQGLLTLLAGLALMSFPGKRQLEIRLLRTPGMARLVAWMRARAGVPPLRLDPPRESP